MSKKLRRGTSLLEFVFLGIPSLFLMLSVVEISLTMWQYHTLEYAAVSAARYVITHGSNCSGTCALNVGNVVSKVLQTAIGLDKNRLTVILKSATWGPTTYSPAGSYASNSTSFPQTADTTVGNDITVTVQYTISNPFVMFWTGAANGGKMMESSTTMQAVSRQRIVF